jgi:hypothetical protein
MPKSLLEVEFEKMPLAFDIRYPEETIAGFALAGGRFTPSSIFKQSNLA